MEKSFVRSGHTWVLQSDLRYIGHAAYGWSSYANTVYRAYHLDAFVKLIYGPHDRSRGHPLRCLVST